MTQRYDKYRDSGVQWLGEIPGHWGCVKLKNLVSKIESGTSVNGSNSQYAKDNEYGVLKTGAVSYRFFNPLQNKLVEGVEIQRLSCPVKKNTIIVSRMNTPELVGSCAIVEKDYPNLFLPDRLWQVYFKENANIKYLHWILNGSYVRTRYAAICVGSSSTMQNISQGQFLDTKIPLPPLSEQQAIVSYLDTKCGQIDKMLEGKQKQIELLQEMKQRVIADAVTRGLNSDVKMKATNIPWLPEIPEHWECKRAKNLFKKEQRPVEEGDDIVTCFRDGEVTLRKNRRTSGFTEATDYSHYQHICKGDLVIHQMDAFAGSSGVSDSDGMGTPVLSVCTPKSTGLDVCYYAHILRMMGKNGFILSLYRGIRERSSDFRFETFAKQTLPVPPLAEQQVIVSYIQERTAKIDLLASKLQQEIENIKEYKQRLISDVVTGQIKVC